MIPAQKTEKGRDLPSPRTRRWKIALYIRLSRDDGNDESLSVSNQRKILLEYAEQAFGGEDTLTDIYIDDGRSGTDAERPDFQRMIRDAEAGRVNCIICKNLSRAFRNYADQGYYLEKIFPRLRIRFIALEDPRIDTFENPEALLGLEIPINGLMNDRFACRTSEEIRRTFRTKRNRGEFIGAFAPYGYQKDPADRNHLIVDPEAAEHVKSIFYWYISGMSKEGIARKLNQMGILNPTAYKQSKGQKYRNPETKKNDGLWQGSGISAILSNEMYTGTMVQGKQRVVSYKVHDRISLPEREWCRVPGTHEAIIAPRIFSLAREMQETGMRGGAGGGRRHLFAGLLKCADCLKAMTRKKAGNFTYFYCSTYKRKSRTQCSPHSIRQDRLEAAVLDSLRFLIEATGQGGKVAEDVKEAPESLPVYENRKKLIEEKEKELSRTEKQIEDLYPDWKNGDLSHSQYCMWKERLGQKAEQLKDSLKKIRAETESKEKREADPELKGFLEQKNICCLSPGLLCRFIKEIRIQEQGTITICFRFPDPAAEESGTPSEK